MSGFLHGLVARTLGKANVLRPRPTPRFAAVDDAFAKPRLGLADESRAANEHYVAHEPHAAGERHVTDERYAVNERHVMNERHLLSERDGNERQVVNEQPPPGLDEASTGSPQKSAGKRLRGSIDRDEPPTPKRIEAAHGEAGPSDPPFAKIPDPEYARSEESRGQLTASPSIPREPSAPRALSADALTPDAATAQRNAPLAPQIAGPRAPASGTRPRERGSAGDLSRDGETVEDETTVVNVTIGRIEVRAPAEPPLRTIRRETQAAPQPRDQLDAYLRARSGR
jgi:hypothetical protein